ncbi:hypothetical protein Tco_0744109 [Tanacetum coccineum]
MADHSQKWHDGTTSRKIGSSSSNDGLAALVKGPHLDKDCPLNEEVKQVEEVRYRGISENIHLVTRTNKGKFCVGTGYYTRLITIPHYEKKGKAGRKYLAMRARGNLHGRSSVNERVDLRRFKRKVLRLILGTKAPR